MHNFFCAVAHSITIKRTTGQTYVRPAVLCLLLFYFCSVSRSSASSSSVSGFSRIRDRLSWRGQSAGLSFGEAFCFFHLLLPRTDLWYRSFSFSSGQGTGRRKRQHLRFLLVHADCICPALSPKNHVCPDPTGNPCFLLLRLLPGSQHHRPRNELFCPFNASWPVYALSLWNRTSVSCCPDSRRDQRSFHHHSPIKSDQLPVSPSL